MSFFSSSLIKPKVIKTTIKKVSVPVKPSASGSALDKRQRELESERERGFPSTSASGSPSSSSSRHGHGNGNGNGRVDRNGNSNSLKRKPSTNRDSPQSKKPKQKVIKRRPSPSSSSSSSDHDDQSHSKSRSRAHSPVDTYQPPPEDMKVEEMMPGRSLFAVDAVEGGEIGIGEQGGWKGFLKCEDLVKENIGKYVPYFPQEGFEVDSFPTVKLQYPAVGCQETFVLLHPRNVNEYAPINDLWRSINAIVDNYIPSSKSHLFGSQSTNTLRAVVPPTSLSRPMTPLSDSNTTPAPTTPVPVEVSSLPTPALAPTSSEEPIIRSLQKSLNRRDGPAFLQALDRFNTTFLSIITSGEMAQHLANEKISEITRRGWEELVDVVQNQVYQRVVGPNVGKLKDYIAFSDNVYGELLPKFVTEIANRYKLGPDSVFVDMGSGVGNVQIQVAVQCGCEAYGGEQAPNPSALATQQIQEAKRRWSMWCLNGNQKCEAYEGDFCEDQRVLKQLKRANLVLINNYAFSADLNERLSWLFLDLHPGAIIISLKPFVQDKAKLTEKMAASPLAILKVKEHRYPARSVSWTDDGGRFYEQTVDRSAIARFMADQEGGGRSRSSRR